MSKTSSSCSRVNGRPAAFSAARACASSSVRPTTHELTSEGYLTIRNFNGTDELHTHVRGCAVDLDNVCGTSVTPPQLARDAPVLDDGHPAVPFILGLLWRNDELAGPCPLTWPSMTVGHDAGIHTLTASSTSGLQSTHH